MGLIISLIVHSAKIQDRDGARYVLAKAYTNHHHLIKTFVDGGYTGKLIEWAQHTLHSKLEVVKRSDLHKHEFKVLPKRWIVERTFGWLGRYRRLSKDYEEQSKSEETFIYLAMIGLMLRRAEVSSKG
jgi:putative transposase